jgi:NADPH:quinone reductase-like Zn-dependent oxidoreductase
MAQGYRPRRPMAMTSQVIDTLHVLAHHAATPSKGCAMRVYQLEKLGDPSGIVQRQRETPRVGPHDILVRVRATSINKRDVFILKGTYPLPAKPGVIPFSDGAGEVVAAGEHVTRFRIGDRVAGNYFARWRSGPIEQDQFDQLGCAIDGMPAEFAVLDEQWAVAVPDHLSWEEAATLPCAGVTAWNSLVGPVPILAGQTVLTLGSGGVSLFALQFAKIFGARVIATTSSQDKAPRLKELGADVVIDYATNREWGKAVRDVTGGRGVDLVVETMGPDTIEQSMRAVSLHGQIMLLIARGVQRPNIEISAQAYAATMATIRRVFVGSRASFEAMNRAIAQARIKPVIDRVFKFEQVQAAFEYFMRGKSFGKVVVTGAGDRPDA